MEHGADDVPYFGIDFAAGTAQSTGMFLTKSAAVRIVVEHDQFRSPPDDQVESGTDADAGGDFETRRPVLERSEGTISPVFRAHERAHRSASDKPGNGNRRLFVR